jgi:hypothetical protein
MFRLIIIIIIIIIIIMLHYCCLFKAICAKNALNVSHLSLYIMLTELV